MSFLRHKEIYPSDGGASTEASAPAHRLDEFPTGYSSAGWSPPLPASASPAASEYAVNPPCRSITFHRTARCVLTICLSRGGKRSLTLCAQDSDWTGEHRVVENRFYISPWPETIEEASRITRDKVVEFISHSGIPSFTTADDLQDFPFASLAPGKIQLVAVIQGGGTIGANLVFIAHCQAAQCVQDYVSSDPPIELPDLLVSLRNDNVKQLLTVDGVVKLDSGIHTLGSYELYELGPSGPEKVTHKYRDWIRARLQALKSEALRKAANEREREIIGAEADYALAQFTDKTGITTNSLLEHAKRWFQSDVEQVQDLAAAAVRLAPDSKLRQELLHELKKSKTENTCSKSPT